MWHAALGQHLQRTVLSGGSNLYRTARFSSAQAGSSRGNCEPYRPGYIAGGPDDPHYYQGHPISDDAQPIGTEVAPEGTPPDECCAGKLMDPERERCCGDTIIDKVVVPRAGADCCRGGHWFASAKPGTWRPHWEMEGYNTVGDCIAANQGGIGRTVFETVAGGATQIIVHIGLTGRCYPPVQRAAASAAGTAASTAAGAAYDKGADNKCNRLVCDPW